jgi:hypothetical protein
VLCFDNLWKTSPSAVSNREMLRNYVVKEIIFPMTESEDLNLNIEKNLPKLELLWDSIKNIEVELKLKIDADEILRHDSFITIYEKQLLIFKDNTRILTVHLKNNLLNQLVLSGWGNYFSSNSTRITRLKLKVEKKCDLKILQFLWQFETSSSLKINSKSNS